MTKAELQAAADRESKRAHALYRALVHVMQPKVDWLSSGPLYRGGRYAATVFDLDGAMGGYVLTRYCSRTTQQAPRYEVHVADEWAAHWAQYPVNDPESTELRELAFAVRAILTRHRQPESVAVLGKDGSVTGYRMT